jgi:hypothetical protein
MTGFRFQINATAGVPFTLPLTNNGTYTTTTVYWGDASDSTITAYDDADRSHTYAGSGTKTIEILGGPIGFSFNNAGDKAQMTGIIDWGYPADFDGFSYLTGGFYGCSNLTDVPENGSILQNPLVPMGVRDSRREQQRFAQQLDFTNERRRHICLYTDCLSAGTYSRFEYFGHYGGLFRLQLRKYCQSSIRAISLQYELYVVQLFGLQLPKTRPYGRHILGG